MRRSSLVLGQNRAVSVIKTVGEDLAGRSLPKRM